MRESNEGKATEWRELSRQAREMIERIQFEEREGIERDEELEPIRLPEPPPDDPPHKSGLVEMQRQFVRFLERPDLLRKMIRASMKRSDEDGGTLQ